MTNQLQKDIDRRIQDKLDKWVEDAADLYEMAGLDAEKEAFIQIAYCLLRALIKLMAITDASPLQIGELVYNMMVAYKQQQQKKHGQA